jgi:hypothetical protein
MNQKTKDNRATIWELLAAKWGGRQTREKAWSGVANIVDLSDRLHCQEDPRLELLVAESDQTHKTPQMPEGLELVRFEAKEVPCDQSFTHHLLAELNVVLCRNREPADFDEFLDLEQPWSIASTARLAGWIEKSPRRLEIKNFLGKVLILIDGVDSIPSPARPIVAAAARNLCRDLGIVAVLFVSRARAFENIAAIVLPQLTLKALSLRAGELLAAKLSQAPKHEPENRSQNSTSESFGDGFWDQVARRWQGIFGSDAGSQKPNRNNKDQTRDAQGKKTARAIAGLIAHASYPSLERLYEIVEAVKNHIQVRREPPTADEGAPASMAPDAEVPKKPSLLRVTSDDVLAQIVFFKILNVAFPAVLFAARESPAGFEELHTFLRHFVSRDLDSEELHVLHAAPWKDFAADERLTALLENALSTMPGFDTPLVHLPASTSGLAEHFDGLLYAGSEAGAQAREGIWIKLLEGVGSLIDRIVDQIAGSATRLQQGQIESRNKLRNQIAAVWKGDGIQKLGNGQYNLSDLDRAARDYLDSRTVQNCGNDLLKNARDGLWELCNGWIDQIGEDARDDDLITVRRGLWVDQLVFYLIMADKKVDASVSEADLSGLNELMERLEDRLSRMGQINQSREGFSRFESLCWIARVQVLLGRVHVEKRKRARIEESNKSSSPSASLGWDESPIGNTLRKVHGMAKGHEERVLTYELLLAMCEEAQEKWGDAEKRYDSIIKRAEAAGLMEHASRASFAQERVRVLSTKRSEAAFLTIAQGMLRLEDAWSPFFSARREHLFISYSRHVYDRVCALALQIGSSSESSSEGDSAPGGTTAGGNVWFDVERIIEPISNYRTEMQLGLDRAGAVLLVLSRSYFESHWCSYELTTTLARAQMNKQQVAWVFVNEDDPNMEADALQTPAQRAKNCARQFSRSDNDRRFFGTQLDALLEKRPLFEDVLQLSGDSSEGWNQLAKNVRAWWPRLVHG